MSDASVVKQIVGGLSMQEDAVQDLLALFAYEGFNPEMVMAHFAKMMKDKNINKRDFATDIRKILILGAMKGNYNSHNKTKISDEGRAVADELYAKYELSEGGASKNRKAINLPRIMAAFPLIATQAIMIAPGKSYSNAFSCSSLSRVWRNPLLPALIPRYMNDKVRNFLLFIATCYTAEQTMTLRQMADATKAYEEQKRYTDISHASSEPSEDERKTYMQTITVKMSELEAVAAKFAEVTKKSAEVPTPDDMKKAGFKAVN